MSQRAVNEFLSGAVTLQATSCVSCGVAFAMPELMIEQLRRSHSSFYCPNGHSLSFQGKPVEETLRAQLAQEKANSEYWRKNAARKERQKIWLKGQVTKAKKRVANGVCPVRGCHRHFDNLGRHMETKHPDFVSQELP